MTAAFTFQGQGSRRSENPMGKALSNAFPAGARRCSPRVDAGARERLDIDYLEGPAEDLAAHGKCQPARWRGV